MNKKTRAFTTSYNKISKVLSNEVRIIKAFSFSNPNKRLSLKDEDYKKYNAIWDTGATGSVITKKVVQDFDLKIVGMVEVHTATSIDMANTYLVNIWLPTKVVFYNLKVTEGKLPGQNEILIGMDIISTGDFAVTNYKGRTVFTFQSPSAECINFVENLIRKEKSK